MLLRVDANTQSKEKKLGTKEVALVIMERGARWPADVAELQARISRAVVDAQQPDESPKVFASRIVKRIQKIVDGGELPVRVVLSTTETHCPDCAAARYKIARAALAAMATHSKGQLVLFSDHSVSDDIKHELFAFAGALCEGLSGSDVGVNVRFSAPTAKSGTHSVRPEALSEPPSAELA